MVRELHRFTIPVCDNAGNPATEAHTRLEVYLARCFGGFTKAHASGAWLNPDTDVVQYEDVFTYDVATDKDYAVGDILAKLCHLFPDQHAFFHAHIGEAQIYDVKRD